MIKIPQQIIKATQKIHDHITPDRKPMFCPECGESLHTFEIANEYVCSSCHFVVGEEDKFCWHCGRALEGLGDMRYWCDNNELDKQSFTDVAEALELSKVDIK